MKLSWGIKTIGAVSIIFGLVDLLNSTGWLILNLENPNVSIVAGLTTFLVTFSLGIVITISGILTFRLHPWAPPLAIVWAAIVTSSILVNQIPAAWEYLTYDHPEGTRIRWGATIGGIIGGLAYPSILFKFYSRPSTKQYFTVISLEEPEYNSAVDTRMHKWKPVIWTVCVFTVLWIASQEIFEAALMVFFVILLFGIFELLGQREL